LAKYWLFVIFDTSEESHLIIFFLKTKIRDSQTLLFSNFRIAVTFYKIPINLLKKISFLLFNINTLLQYSKTEP